MRSHAMVLSLALAAAVASACSGMADFGANPSGPTGVGGNGSGGGSTSPSAGRSTTITASSMTTGGAYGSGGNYFFSPSPDTVVAGTMVTFQFGSVTHNVVFASANAPANIPASTNTSVNRTFSTPGAYSYQCTIHGFGGVLVVQ